MRRRFSRLLAAGVAVALVPIAEVGVSAQVAGSTHRGFTAVAAASVSQLRQWDTSVDQMLREGSLETRQVREDTLMPGRVHERYSQLHQGIPVFGGDLARQTEGGVTLSIFGTLYEGIDVDPVPTLSVDEAAAIIERRSGQALGPSKQPVLTILPTDDGGYALTYRARVMTTSDLTMYFIDARSGEVVLQYSDLKRQSAVGVGQGVLGDQKKISVESFGGQFVASDALRPPAISTFDLRGDVGRAIDFLNGVVGLNVNDLAGDGDNVWTDGANVDAHVYSGLMYDYLFKQFGRRGLDNANLPILSLVHSVNRANIFTAPDEIVGLFYLNAFYSDGIMVYGEGLPSNVTFLGATINYFAGALDIVAHELTHGVTDFSSRLVYRNESGALSEAFSDILGTGAEFFFQPQGGGPLRADYLLGEDIISPPTPGLNRSLQNPRALGDPDHYSRRFLGPEDNGGVHTNATIAGHAFYLAIEGGTNRTSGRAVRGVGGANRAQIERAFYRAFVFLLPSNATYSLARAAVIQAAIDLYGAGSNVHRAVTDAWTAVGVS